MLPTKIGLISDTHGLLRKEAKRALQGCDIIIHAGDVDEPDVLQKLQNIAPTTAVRGNMDLGSWAKDLKTIERLEVGSWSIVVVHNIHDLPLLDDTTNIVIFGHSHKFLEQTTDGVLFINPGSAGPRRFTLPISMAILTLGEKPLVERVVLANKA